MWFRKKSIFEGLELHMQLINPRPLQLFNSLTPEP